jgi:hypothetical protein
MMQKRTLALLLLLAVATAFGGAWLVLNRPGTVGATAAREAAREQPVAPFRNVAVEGFADVTLVQGEREGVVVDTGPKGGTAVTVEVRGDTLHVSATESRRWWHGFGSGTARVPRVTITFRTLETLRLAGAVRVRAVSVRSPTLTVTASGAASVRVENLEADALKVSGAGAVKAEFAGRAREQRIALAGAGVFRGAELAGDHVRVSVSGAGKASVRAAQTLDVAISGAGSVEYSGDPKVTEDISGAGKIRRRSAGDGESARVRVAAAQDPSSPYAGSRDAANAPGAGRPASGGA